MPADDAEPVRRSVVPPAAGRSLWGAAVWTGAGAALVSAVVAIVAVAVCWLPASAGEGNSGSAIRAGLLTFLAALHGGITVSGLDAAFVPLGLTLLAGAIAWRAGIGLADAAEELGEDDTTRLLRAALMQTASFVVVCGVAAAGSHLGTSRVSVAGAVIAGALLFGCTAGVAFVRYSVLADDLADRAPAWLAPSARIAAATVTVYLGAGALLVLCSLVAHYDRVETLSRQVGGGWSGVPILLLGVLAAPNAVIAASSYLAGPGFAVGSGTTVALGSSPHGTLPAFPLLGALPTGPAAWSAWLLAVLTPLAAGCVAARLALRATTWRGCWRDVIGGVAGAGLLGLLLAWLGGGAIGSGRLHAVGASPWQFGLVVLAGCAIASAGALGVAAGYRALRAAQEDDAAVGGLKGSLVALSAVASSAAETIRQDAHGEDEPKKGGKLAG